MKESEIIFIILAIICLYFRLFFNIEHVFKLVKKFMFLLNIRIMPYFWFCLACFVSAYISGTLSFVLLIISWISYECVKIKKQQMLEKEL